MRIKKFNDINKINQSDSINENAARTELFGVHRAPSYIYSRGEQDFYDYYTRQKFRGESKYKLNTEVFKIAQESEDVNDRSISQMLLQVERESIAADEWIVNELESLREEIKSLKKQLGIKNTDNEIVNDGDNDEDELD